MFRQLVESYGLCCMDLPEDLKSGCISPKLYFNAGNDILMPAFAPFATDSPFIIADIKMSDPIWDHMIYAFLTENTRLYEIFRRVVAEFRNGEKLGPLSPDATQWLIVTEQLLYTPNHTVGSVAPVASAGAPDWDASRRNAYYRLFGFDLNHGTEDNRPYPYIKPPIANKEFGVTLETLLCEVWKGITNAGNTSGARETDDSTIANLVLRLNQMLNERKSNGKLIREEFWAVTTMSWLHMAIEDDTPIVQALQAGAASAEERLRKIGQLVGIPAHDKTQAFLLLARELSVFLREVELGMFTTPATAQALYHEPVSEMMANIIAQYSIATGKDIKAKQVNLASQNRMMLSR